MYCTTDLRLTVDEPETGKNENIVSVQKSVSTQCTFCQLLKLRILTRVVFERRFIGIEIKQDDKKVSRHGEQEIRRCLHIFPSLFLLLLPGRVSSSGQHVHAKQSVLSCLGGTNIGMELCRLLYRTLTLQVKKVKSTGGEKTDRSANENHWIGTNLFPKRRTATIIRSLNNDDVGKTHSAAGELTWWIDEYFARYANYTLTCSKNATHNLNRCQCVCNIISPWSRVVVISLST